MIKILRDFVESFNDNLAVLNTTMADTCSQVADNNSEVQNLKSEVRELERRNIKLKAHTRPENVKNYNLPEITSLIPSDTEDLVSFSVC